MSSLTVSREALADLNTPLGRNRRIDRIMNEFAWNREDAATYLDALAEMEEQRVATEGACQLR